MLNWSELKPGMAPSAGGFQWFFDGAIYPDETGLPYYMSSKPVRDGESVQVLPIRTIYEPFPVGKAPTSLAGFGNEVMLSTKVVVERKQRLAQTAIMPIRKNPMTGQLERLIGFDLQYNSVPALGSARASSEFADGSVLASGDWFRVEVATDGIYRLTRENLETLGMDMNSIDPRKIRIYGNGGGMLPALNSAPRHDDLVENAILVTGEADGNFDEGDQVIFYASGPHRWAQESAGCKPYKHEFNVYSDKAAFFVTASLGNGKRVGQISSADASETHVSASFDAHELHESDERNLIKTGRKWVGELFDLQTSYSFDFSTPDAIGSEPAYLGTRLLSKSLGSSVGFSVRLNGTTVTTVTIPSGTGGTYEAYAKESTDCIQTNISSANTSVTFTYNKGSNPSALGWLDYLEVQLRRNLNFRGGQLGFRDSRTVGSGNVTRFDMTGASSGVRIWDVTDQTQVTERLFNLTGGTASFKIQTDTLREFFAFDGSAYLAPDLKGRVENQNLHALGQVNMVVIAPEHLMSEAERLAQFHRENERNPLTVHLVTPQQVFNEFSGGVQDIVGVRDMMRMFYERASNANEIPRYLLFFGDASYDYKDRIQSNTNMIPTYQSEESLTPTTSHCSDDFFGLLDPAEGLFANDALDIGIGRFPITTLEQAKAIVDKIYRYEQITGSSFGTGPLCGDNGVNIGSAEWRNTVVFIGDDEDQDIHMKQADALSVMVDTLYPEYDLKKIFLDSYVQESTPGGERYPDANRDFNLAVQKGALILNYTGHGGELGLTHERVLGVSDINSWTNIDNLPAFVTATCEFSRYDDPERISAGEYVLLNANGGGIALFTTSRLVYSAPNFTLNQNFYRKLQEEQPWGLPTMGDVIRMTKVASGSSVNNRNFVLLGDPAQRLSYPEHKVETTFINAPVSAGQDTVRALELVTIKGRVLHSNGTPYDDFNGVIYPMVFDKTDTIQCLRNNPDNSFGFKFPVQKNLIYRGKATVTDGQFEFSFVVPRDIAYRFGNGRISYYAEGANTNAHGYFNDFVIGGSSTGTSADAQGPAMRVFMNDDKFVFGGTTDEDPVLLAFLNDSNGINTVGNGIGHNITAILDGNTNSTISLNDYYQADLDSYKSGRVAYPFKGLSQGTHDLRLKVWDVYNNSSEGYLEFVVASSAELALEHVLNYPNPFSTNTSFFFEHNRPCGNLSVTVQVFSISGKLVKTINEDMVCNGYRSDPIEWDGRDDYGQRIGRGVYMYSMRVRTDDGLTADHLDKLVILN